MSSLSAHALAKPGDVKQYRCKLCRYYPKCKHPVCRYAHQLDVLLPPDERVEEYPGVWRDGVDRWYGQRVKKKDLDMIQWYYDRTAPQEQPAWSTAVLWFYGRLPETESVSSLPYDFGIYQDLEVVRMMRASQEYPFEFVEGFVSRMAGRKVPVPPVGFGMPNAHCMVVTPPSDEDRRRVPTTPPRRGLTLAGDEVSGARVYSNQALTLSENDDGQGPRGSPSVVVNVYANRKDVTGDSDSSVSVNVVKKHSSSDNTRNVSEDCDSNESSHTEGSMENRASAMVEAVPTRPSMKEEEQPETSHPMMNRICADGLPVMGSEVLKKSQQPSPCSSSSDSSSSSGSMGSGDASRSRSGRGGHASDSQSFPSSMAELI